MSEPARQAPRVLVIATGGTIAGTTKSRATRRYKASGLGVTELLDAAQGPDHQLAIQSLQVSAIGSQDMNLAVWRELVTAIEGAFAADEADAVVIAHGTDTIEETGFLLDLIIPPGRPIVLAGATRPANALGADGPRNLSEAIHVGASPQSRGRGVLVVLNDEVHAARFAFKARTFGAHAFESFPGGALGVVSPTSLTYFQAHQPRSLQGRLRLPATSPLPSVVILHAHADMDAVLVEKILEMQPAGVVLAGMGHGNASSAAVEQLARAAARGTLVVRSSRVAESHVDRNLEIDDDALGFVAARDLSPQKARVLLQLLIASGASDPGAIQSAFDQV